jgi:glycosyltransferase involved in cell wall biosynthesis
MVFAYRRAQEEYLREGVAEARTEVIPFCADDTRFTGSAAAPAAGEPFKLLVSSRLVPGKGHDLLLEAVARLGTGAGPLEVHFAGDGPTRPELEAQVQRLGLEKMVRFLGMRPHAELPALLRGVHAIVLPTHMPGETFPVSLLEAACVGLPAIGTRWFGIPDIIADGTSGLLVDPRDVAGLSAAIARLAPDRALWARLSAGARQRAQERFTSTRVAQAYARVYEAVL